MPDEMPKKRPLSEIGHLFLSSVRDRHMGGVPAPTRTPPGAPRPLDLTPRQHADAPGDELGGDAVPAGSYREDDIDAAATDADADAGADTHEATARPVTAVIAAHLGGRQLDRARQYARHLAARVGRVGLIELDASEFRVACYDAGAAPEAAAADEPRAAADAYNPRQIAEAIEELNWDVDRWLLVIPNPRTPEAKELLRLVAHWTLLTTCDHDGVVGSYRMLKGLADGCRPALSLAALDAPDAAEVGRVFEKLQSVCGQFLDWPLEAEAPVGDARGVAEHVVAHVRPNRDKGQLAFAPTWPIVADLVARAAGGRPAPLDFEPADATAETRHPEPDDADMPLTRDPQQAATMTPPTIDARYVAAAAPAPAAQPAAPEPMRLVGVGAASGFVAPPATPAAHPAADPFAAAAVPTSTFAPASPFGIAPQPVAPPFAPDAPRAADEEVIDLPGGPDAPAESILAAVLGRPGAGWVECPVRPPMCPDARLAVGRDRRLVVAAVARRGLGDLRAIGQAYRWAIENRSLIAMAVPQFAIDPHLAPGLRLLVDQADLTADVLRPMLQAGDVTVQAYRKLRWNGRAGLLLEAA